MTNKNSNNKNLTYFHASNLVDFEYAWNEFNQANFSVAEKIAFAEEFTKIWEDFKNHTDPDREEHVFFFTDTDEYEKHREKLCKLYDIDIVETYLICEADKDFCWVLESFFPNRDKNNYVNHYVKFIAPLPKSYSYVADFFEDYDDEIA